MLTIDEYRRAYRAADWRMGRRFVLLFGGAVLYLHVPVIAYALNYGRLRDEHMTWLVNKFGLIWPIIGIVIYSIPAIILAYFSVHRIDRFLEADDRLRCPHCKATQKGLMLTIATNRCPHCSHQVLMPAVTQSKEPLMDELPTIEEFNQQTTSLLKRTMKRILVAAIASILMFIVGGVAYRWMDYGPDSGMIGWFLMPAIIVLFALIWKVDQLDRDSQVTRCRYCRNSLMHNCRDVVIATRNCGYCGRRVLAEPDPVVTALDSNSACSS